jgi:zinc transport system ATP-binding protein
MTRSVISLDNISFTFGDFPVLENISLEVKEKEFLGIVGPNGGGKSTLLKLVLGLLKPMSGKIEVLGKTPEQAHKQLGYVPQFILFDRDFPITVRETVLQGRLGKTRPVFGFRKKDLAIARETMTKTEILDLENRPIASLSGGQLQRVLIARALACEPEILLLDEPTANIDPKVEEDVFSLLKNLNKHITIIVVSHDIGFISHFINRVACLNRTLVCHTTSRISGKMIEDLYGSPLKMVHHHTIIDPGSGGSNKGRDSHERLP